MTKEQKTKIIVNLLKEIYPYANCSLVYNKEKPYELLIATRLSAQCTDARVNVVTKELFKKYKTLESFANAKIEDVEIMVKSCGFYRMKAADIVNMSRSLIQNYNSILPNTIEELTTLPGVGRKTANLIVGDIYGKPAIVTDTHCIRICGRLGLTTSKNPKKTEDELRKILEPNESSDFCHRIVLFGRDICKAQNPKCSECRLATFCNYKKSTK